MKQFSTLTLVGILLLLGAGAWAQGTVKGKITDSNGEPLIGASVGVAGTGRSASTDADGMYSLSLSNGTYQINVAYTGFKNRLEYGYTFRKRCNA